MSKRYFIVTRDQLGELGRNDGVPTADELNEQLKALEGVAITDMVVIFGEEVPLSIKAHIEEGS